MFTMLVDTWQQVKLLINRFKYPLLIILFVIIANSLYFGVFNANPINLYSGLAKQQTSGVFPGLNYIDPNIGFTSQALGKAAVNDIIHGHLPWWNNNEQVGAPLAGEMQSAALFPLTLLMYFANGILFFHIFLEIIAAVATYYLLRKLGCRELSSALGGIAFGLSSTFAWFGSANVNPVAFLPVLVLGVEQAYQAAIQKKRVGWVLIALGLALSIYAGFPETTYIDGLLVAVWALYRLSTINKRLRLVLLRKLLMGLSIGLALAAPIIIAFIDYLPQADVGIHAIAITYGLPAIGMAGFLMPYIYGPIFGFYSFDHSLKLMYWWSSVGGYESLLVVFLAILALISFNKIKSNRGLKYLLAAWIIIMTARVYAFPGLASILNLIPGVRRTAIYRYSQPSINFAFVILLAFLIDFVLVNKDYIKVISRKKIAISLLIALMLIAAVLPLAISEHYNLIGAPHQRLWLIASVSWAIGTVSAAAVLLWIGKQKIVTMGLLILVLADTLFLFITPQFSTPKVTGLDLKPIAFLQQHLVNQRFYSLGPIQPNYSSYFGISSINTNNLPISKKWSSFVKAHLDSNAKPTIFTGFSPSNPTGLSPLNAFLINISSYEYVGVKYLVVPSGLVTTIQARSVNLKQVYNDNQVAIYLLPHSAPYFSIIKGKCSISSTSKETVLANCKTPTTILRRELYMPGWTAIDNGQKLLVSAQGPLFQQVKVGAGINNISYNFTPPHMIEAYIAFALGVLTIIIYLTPLHDFNIKLLIDKKFKE